MEIKESHRIEIEEYLKSMDLIDYIKVEELPISDERKNLTVMTQPGLRYSQAKILIEQLLKDKIIQELKREDVEELKARILNEIKGRMMEEIVLLETKMAYPRKNIIKVYFKNGEFDMLVENNDEITCEIYEIKHSDKIVPDQYHNLVDEEKCTLVDWHYGRIIRKAVIYRGENKVLDNGIEYLNVEDYLKGLYKD